MTSMPSAQDADPQGDLTLINGQWPYGAEYWLPPQATAEDFRRDLAQLHETGMNVIRIFVPQIEVAPDRYDFGQLDALMDEASGAGVAVAPTYSLRLPPWRLANAGLDTTIDIPVSYLLDDRAYREQLAPAIEALVTRYRGHEALWSWILWNEPSRQPSLAPPPPTWWAFREWLDDVYDGDIEALNDAWFPERRGLGLRSFEGVQPEQLAAEWKDAYVIGGGMTRYRLGHPLALRLGTASWGASRNRWDNYSALRDWLLFNMHAMDQSIGWLHDLTKQSDPEHPTQINPDGFIRNQPAAGRNLWSLSGTVDLWGSSLHAGHHLGLIDAENEFPETLAFYTRYIVDANKGRPSVITELQGGPNIWSGNKNFAPDGSDLVLWNLGALAGGIRGVIYWMWKPRKHGWEGGEWGLVNSDGHRTTRTEGAARVGRFLQDQSAWLRNLRPAPAAAAILHSPDTEMLSIRQAGSKHDPSSYQVVSEYGCYKALWRAGIPAEIVTPYEVRAGRLSRYRCLLIPYTEALDADTAEAIVTYAMGGGWVYGETPLARLDEQGTAYDQAPGGGLTAIFPRAIDVWPQNKAATLELAEDDIYSHLFIQPLRPQPGSDDVLADIDDYPVVLERDLTGGRTLYVGTSLCHHIGSSRDTATEENLLADFCRRAGADPDWGLEEQIAGVSVSLLLSEEADAMVVLNHTDDDQRVPLVLPQTYARVEQVWPEATCECERTSATVQLPPRSGAVLRMTKA